MPRVSRSKDIGGSIQGFPVDHYSYSAWEKFSTDPFMFKVNYLNGDTIDTASSPTNAIGRSMHKALEAYFGGGDHATPADDGEAIKLAHEVGLAFLAGIYDSFIEYNTVVKNRAQLEERFAYTFFQYMKEQDFDHAASEIVLVEKMLKHKVIVDERELPVPLKGQQDLVYRGADKKLHIKDYKFTSKFSDLDSIDASKLVQAVYSYFLVYAELGEAPIDITFDEFKIVQNKDGSPQTHRFTINFEETPLMFDLFFRLYGDITDALMGKQVFIPNFRAMFDREVALLAYIHRLDVTEVRAAELKKLKVDNITDFLKKKIQTTGSMKKYLETVSKKFVSASTLNYSTMRIEDKIKMKLAEHGLGVEFDSKITGSSVELYRYEPSVGLKMTKIEAYVKDIEQVVQISGIRVLAPIPDSGLIGFEVPLKKRTFPKEKPEAEGFNLAIGVDIEGNIVRSDIREAPHMLVAGSTGSGKSVFVANLIRQLQSLPKSLVQLVLLDPKMVELQQFSGGAKYADNPEEITGILEGLVKDMDSRYKVLQQQGYKNLAEMQKDQGDVLPYIFVFLDEYGDLMASRKYSTDIKEAVFRLGQKARAAGIHMILTTQRPSTKIISGDIKANFPTRVAFKTATQVDSQVIIDQGGSEKLLGKGDMLFRDNGSAQLRRLQGFNL